MPDFGTINPLEIGTGVAQLGQLQSVNRANQFTMEGLSAEREAQIEKFGGLQQFYSDKLDREEKRNDLDRQTATMNLLTQVPATLKGLVTVLGKEDGIAAIREALPKGFQLDNVNITPDGIQSTEWTFENDTTIVDCQGNKHLAPAGVTVEITKNKQNQITGVTVYGEKQVSAKDKQIEKETELMISEQVKSQLRREEIAAQIAQQTEAQIKTEHEKIVGETEQYLFKQPFERIKAEERATTKTKDPTLPTLGSVANVNKAIDDGEIKDADELASYIRGLYSSSTIQSDTKQLALKKWTLHYQRLMAATEPEIENEKWQTTLGKMVGVKEEVRESELGDFELGLQKMGAKRNAK